MILLYNCLQLFALPLLLFILPLLLGRRPEKWRMIGPRLGYGLAPPQKAADASAVIWIHALSVGEVTSALPLIRALRETDPSSTLLLSVTTISGKKLAEQKALPDTDGVIFFPFDILPVVKHFITRIKPDLFILVETDYWPNLLHALSVAGIPAVLVNGRISRKSIRSYRRFAWFFRSLFNRFHVLCMQTGADAAHMRELGVDADKLHTLGNLKFAPTSIDDIPAVRPINKRDDHLLILAASTHAGEEEMILLAFSRLLNRHKNLQLAIAPRNPRRSEELVALAVSSHHTVHRYSDESAAPTDITIIDTIGDLSSLFTNADIAFIGGSLVPEGGHNPLEATRHGCPVIFGPYMDDFLEISGELLDCRAACEVSDSASLEAAMDTLISSNLLRRNAGYAGRACTHRHHNVIKAHLAVIKQFL